MSMLSKCVAILPAAATFAAALLFGPVPAGAQTVVSLANGNFSGPAGVAVDGSGNVFVVDIVTNTVKEVLASNHTTVNTLASANGNFLFPIGIAVDRNGNLFVTDSSHNLVKEILAAGGYVTVNTLASGNGNFSQPSGIAIDGNGNLFVADAGNGVVKELLAPGYTTVNTIGQGTLITPAGVAVDGNGNLFVSDLGSVTVQEALAANSYATFATLAAANGNFAQPFAIAIDGAGNLYVADIGNNTVKEIVAAGSYVTVNTLPAGNLNLPVGIAVDAAGNVFVGDTNNGALKEIVRAATITLASSANPSPPGLSVTFTATVSSAGGTPTGTVTFLDGAVTLGTGSLVSGTATFSTSALSLGSHSITAAYGGDSSFTSSVSSALSQTVSNRATITTLSSSANPGTPGQPVTFTAVLAGSGATPTGTVTFLDGTTTLGTGSLVSGTATYTAQALSAGSHSITASYGGDSNYDPGTSAVLTQAMGQPATTTTVTSSANPSTAGQSVTFTATVSSASGTPTGTVTFMDGTVTLGSGSLASGTATFTTTALSIGSHSITASYAGSGGLASSTSAALVQTVSGAAGAAATTTTLSSSANPSPPGQTVTFTAVVSGLGGTPTGTVTFLDGTTTLGTGSLVSGTATYTAQALATGSHSITASYGGDNSFAASVSPALLQTVGNNATATTTTTLSSSANPSPFGQLVTFTATVGGSGGIPSGTVTYSDGAATLGTASLVSGKATYSTSALSTGSHSITASYSGDGSFSPSASVALVETVSVVGTASTTTTLVSSANPSPRGYPVTFTATVSSTRGTPTGTVTFLDGTATLGSAGLVAGTASYTTSTLSSGSHSIKASYGGGGSFAASTSAVLTQTSSLFSQTITFGALTPRTYGAAAFSISATSNSPLPISFTTTTNSVCGVSGTTVTIVGAGTCTIVASQTGNSTYTAAPPVTQSFVVAPAVLTVTAKNANMFAGATLPALTAQIAGFVNGDTSAVVSGAPSLTTSATSTSAPGSYPIVAAQGTLSAANYTFSYVGATLTITARPAAGVSVLSGDKQTGVQGSALPAPLVAVVTDSTGSPVKGASVTFTVLYGAASLNPNSAVTGSDGKAQTTVTPTAAGTSTIQAAVAGLSETAIFYATGLSTPPVPQMSVLPAVLTFTMVQNGAAPAPASLAVSNMGAGRLPWTASVGSGASWLSLGSVLGSTPAVIPVKVNGAGLAVGTYPSSITVTSGNQQQVVALALIVKPPVAAQLATAPAALVVNAPAGSFTPLLRTVSVANAGSGTLAWSATTDAGWLTVSPAFGAAPSTVTVKFDPSGLASGQYYGKIAFSSPGVADATVAVVLDVSALPDLTSSVPLLQFRGVTGGTLLPQALPVGTSTGGAVSFTTTTELANGTSWLTLGAANGITPATVTAAVNTRGLVSGTYLGYVSGQSASARNGLLVPVVVDLGSGSAPGTLSASPGGVLLAGPASSSSGAPLTAAVALVSNGATFSWQAAATADAGGAWLSVSPALGSGNGTVTVTANIAGLKPGAYTGQVAISADTSNPRVIVPVTLLLTSGTTAVTSGSTLQPTEPAGDFVANVGVPVLLKASLLSPAGATVAGGTVQVSFTTGETPVTMTDAGKGTYTGVWTPTQSGPVSLLFVSAGAPTGVVTGTVSDPGKGQPVISGSGPVSAAGFVSGMPLGIGSISTLFGLNLASQTAAAAGLPVSPLGGTTMTINGVATPLFYASPGQVNFSVPWELAGQTTATIVVATAGGVAALGGVPIASGSPGLFQVDAAGDAAAIHASGQLVSVTAPAAAGEVVEIFATGLGPVSNTPADGAAAPADRLAISETTPSVTIGGVPAQVTFAGLAPGFVGLFQLNVVVPSGLPPGPATLAIDSVLPSSNTAILYLR